MTSFVYCISPKEDRRTERISLALAVESFLRTRSTDCAAASFLKPSKIVAAVKSIGRLNTKTSEWSLGRRTTQGILIQTKCLVRASSSVQSFDVLGVELEGLIAVLDDLLVLCGVEVDIARRTVAEEHRLRLGRDCNRSRVQVDGSLEAVMLIGSVTSCLERGCDRLAFLGTAT